MPQTKDPIVTYAEAFSKKAASILESCQSEEDIRHGLNVVIDAFIETMGIDVKGRHEFALLGGRIDSRYGGVLFEYKYPKGAKKIGDSNNTAGAKEVIEQLQTRFLDLRKKEKLDLERLLGIGCDGKSILFVTYRHEQFHITEPQLIDSYGSERIFKALVALGSSGLPYVPNQLISDFGRKSLVGREAIMVFYNTVVSNENPTTRVLFEQWKILFGEVWGHNFEKSKKQIESLGKEFNIRKPKPPELLFSIHSYYALFIKLLAGEIVRNISPANESFVQKITSAPSRSELKRELSSLEKGGIWSEMGIHNFLEGDIFSWYLFSWSEQISNAIRSLGNKMRQYDTNTLSIENYENRDLLRDLYEHLFPRELRHALGEYYTPDWLADFTLDQTDFDGNPEKRVLDPSCGSGTFLVSAIGRCKMWYRNIGMKKGISAVDFLKLVANNIVGFDLNPLAVMAARTNYLLNMQEFLTQDFGGMFIPVYLCDSVVTPTTSNDLFEGGKARKITTSVGDFQIPSEIAKNSETLRSYMGTLELAVEDNMSEEQFFKKCKKLKIDTDDRTLHINLLNSLKDLHRSGRNGIWTKILQNAFAPLFVEPFDYIVGNPPWINWETLPRDYRDSTAQLWADYGLFDAKGLEARLGGAKDDFSVLMTYVAGDCYLKLGGTLVFVITQSVFQTAGGGRGFRKMLLKDDVGFGIKKVHDFSKLKPFPEATNRTAVVLMKKGYKAKYPVPYVTWHRSGKFDHQSSLSEVKENTVCEELFANPVSETDLLSPWMVGTKAVHSLMDKLSGRSTYQARKGIYCATNTIFWLDKVKKLPNKQVLISNVADSGKMKVLKVEQVVEDTYIYGLVRGKDVSRWNWSSTLSIILPQDKDDPKKAVSLNELSVDSPQTYSYFKQFETQIMSMAMFKQFFRSGVDPFYSSYNVGNYTFGKYRVAWKEIASSIEAVVIEDGSVMPDHKLVIVASESRDEAHFICGILNSKVVELFVRSYAMQTSISGHIFKYAAVPQFNKRDEGHKKIAALSIEIHKATLAGQSCQGKIDELDLEVGNLWDISKEEIDFATKMVAGKVKSSKRVVNNE